jgi:predicted nucleic-acid-binding Zn-ribbon protein
MPEPQVNGTQQSPGRPFPWFCPRCRKKEVRPATIAFQTERLHEGRVIAVEIPALLVPKCANCGELVFNYAADEQILDAVKAQAAIAGHVAS